MKSVCFKTFRFQCKGVIRENQGCKDCQEARKTTSAVM